MIDDLDFLGTEELNFKSIFLQVAQLVVYHQVVSNWCVCVCVYPNGLILNFYNPSRLIKAVFSRSVSFTSICQLPE